MPRAAVKPRRLCAVPVCDECGERRRGDSSSWPRCADAWISFLGSLLLGLSSGESLTASVSVSGCSTATVSTQSPTALLRTDSALVSRRILGRTGDPRFAGRRVEVLVVPAEHAGRRRLRARTAAGTDVGLDVPAGSYLFDGAVLFDDGERIIVVERPAQEAAIVRLSPGEEDVVSQAVRLGHALGNLHASLEVVQGEIGIPVTTSPSVMRQAIEALHLHGVQLGFARVPLGCERTHSPARRGATTTEELGGSQTPRSGGVASSRVRMRFA